MTESTKLIEQIGQGVHDGDFSLLYGANGVEAARTRYVKAVESFVLLYGNQEVSLFSAPGRTEIGGNHTDHQHGRVLAASINLDVIAVVAKNSENTVRIKSEGYPADEIKLNHLIPMDGEIEKAASLIRGVCARFKDLGYSIGGFNAYTVSNVLKGSGLSSSAAFEVLVGTVMSGVYNGGAVSAVEIAKIGQYAERNFFGKPSGLMDQTASSVGGFVSIDFKNNETPVIESVKFNFDSVNHSLCIVDTGGDHADLTSDYASITEEMREVATLLGGNLLREVDDGDFLKSIPSIRSKCSDRAILRAIHFFSDNHRVTLEVDALKRGDFEEFKRLIIESGDSSYKYLQNIYSVNNVRAQCVSLALAVSEMLLEGKGAWRVHGGGFGGTIQAFVPNDMLDTYKTTIESVMGAGSCYILKIRPVGGYELNGERK